MTWIEFLLSALCIVFAGVQLTESADEISDRYGWGKAWIGIVLLGMVTSLPEAIASVTAVATLKANNLALGNLMGSNNFNPLLVVVMDVMYRKGSIVAVIHQRKTHDLSAYLAILMVIVVMSDIALSSAGVVAAAGPLSLSYLVLTGLYFGGMYYISRIQDVDDAEVYAPEEFKTKPLNKLLARLLFSIVLVVAGAMWLASSADRIAEQTGMGGTFVGSIMLAMVTSLPEIVVSVAAFRVGQPDMAIGNIFGSNMTNMFIVVITGLFHGATPLLAHVSTTHIFTGGVSIVMTYLGLRSLHLRREPSFYGIGLNSLIMIAVFAAGSMVLYRIG